MSINTKKLTEIINIKDLNPDVIEEFKVSNEIPWVQDLVNELEEDNEGEKGELPSKIELDLKITLRSVKFYGDYVTVRAGIKAEYYAPCIRCLALTRQEFEHDVNGLFLHDTYASRPEYQDISSYFIENEEMELYFHKKGQVELKEFIHEQIYIEKEAFPRCTGECVNKVLF
ncbi:MAG: DUF177 domain-containing protein [Bacteriovoracaceae bacterium]|jgi:uncharacterized metal-binding protein YceD (DUF177 family)|nr:DUF177 domain-containing protein [Bacteriovoracaceae bacterium]